MNNENKEVNYLNQIIELQKQMIDFLKSEVERLKTAPVYYAPLTNPNPIVGPGLSPANPNPFINPFQPSYPTTPWIVTCQNPNGSTGTTANITNEALISTVNLPMGSVQASTQSNSGLLKALENSGYKKHIK